MIFDAMTIGEIFNLPQIRPLQGQMISSAQPFFSPEDLTLTLSEFQKNKQPTWNAEDMTYGLSRLVTLADRGVETGHPAGNILYLPADERKTDTYAVLLSGGAYGAVCTMVESLPVAARLNELGMDCWCLNYRTATQQSFVGGLLPAPLEDLAQALREIGCPERPYVVGGFSAGGHVAALWGTAHLGARHYGLPQPKALLLAYPLLTMNNLPDSPIKKYMCSGMFGATYTQEDIDKYDVNLHLDENYPKSFLVRCQDDTTVPAKDGDDFLARLTRFGISHQEKRGKIGGHGFGLGSATDVPNWVEKAFAFTEGAV